MIASQFIAQAQRTPNSPAVCAASTELTYAELQSRVENLSDWLHEQNLSGHRVGVVAQSLADLVAAAVAADAANVQPVLIDAADADHAVKFLAGSHRKDPSLATMERKVEVQLLIPHDSRSGEAKPAGTVGMLTSGTSGPPKLAIHRWQNLAAAVHRDERFAGKRWLLGYDAARFAGVQVWLQALLTGGTVCVPVAQQVESVIDCLEQNAVQFASGTPTFWRLLLHNATPTELAKMPLEQITLGGEAVDQPLLAALANAFPRTRIAHIYASTEMGVCFSVSDGRAGFPAAWLGDLKRPIPLRQGSEGALEVRSPRRMLNAVENQTHAGWFDTGDLIKITGDRAMFVGRASDVINVGGVKVRPRDVEDCIRGAPGVRDVCVSAIASSLVGQLVTAEIESDGTLDDEQLLQEVLAHCRLRLSKPQIPAQLRIVQQLAVNTNWKRSRTAEPAHVR